MHISFSAGRARFTRNIDVSGVVFVLGDKQLEIRSGRRTLCPAIAPATPGDLIDNSVSIPQMLRMIVSDGMDGSSEQYFDVHFRASDRHGIMRIRDSKVHAGSL